MKIAVIGIGNVLMGDDSLGPHVIAVLEARYRFPPEVHVFETGTAGADLSGHLAHYDRVVLIDAVDGPGEPGTAFRYDKKELLDVGSAATTPHEPSVKEALWNLELTDEGIEEVSLIGVKPLLVDAGVGLSPVVAAALPKVLDAVIDTLSGYGYPPEKKDPADEPNLWWLRRNEGPTT